MSTFQSDFLLNQKSLNSNDNLTNTNEEEYNTDNKITRKIEFDKGSPLSYDFNSNKVHTLPYSLKGFFIFIYHKMGKKAFNILILFVLIFFLIAYACTPEEISHLEMYPTVIFHTVIIVLEFIFYSFEFLFVYINDVKINNQKSKIYNNQTQKFEEVKWGDIVVGNIVKVLKDEVVPADIIVLDTLERNHLCYLDYSSVNGVFDTFEVKKACNDTRGPSLKSIKFHDYVRNIKGVLKYEEPNGNMNSFIGRLKLDSFPRASDISNDNFILRGTTIKNIKAIYGLVVYTGMDTKIMQSLKKENYENTKNETTDLSRKENEKEKMIIKKDRDVFRVKLKLIQNLIITLYFILVFLSSLIELQKVCLCYYSFSSPIGDDHLYLEFANIKEKNEKGRYGNPFFELYLSIVIYVLYYFLLLPFDWFLLIEIAYFFNGKFIEWDVKLYSKKNKDKQIEIINYNCLSEFGIVRHILTDKTGTLTSRKYKLKICSIQGKLFSFESLSASDENYIFKEKSQNPMNDLEIYQELHSNSSFSSTIKEFLRLVSVCHSVTINKSRKIEKKVKDNDNKQDKKNENIQENEKVKFASCFAEEKAMLKTFSKIGYTLQRSKEPNVMSLQIDEEINNFYVIATNKYTEDRKRMSVIVKDIQSDTNYLLCKSNDISILKLLKHNQRTDNLIAKTKIQISDLRKFGLRYFIFCKKVLSEDETSTFLSKYKSAENYVIKSEEHLRELAIEYEKDMDFLGVLFFEEKIPKELKLTIKKLNSAGIKVWMASGDKRENVLSVAKNINLYNPSAIIGEFNDKDMSEDLDIKMSTLLMQFLFPNEKISKMKTRKGISVEAQAIKGSKDLTIILSGGCFTRICNDQRNFQSLATLLSYCTNLLGYNFNSYNKYSLCKMIKCYATKNSKVLAIGDGFSDFTMLKEADLSVGIRSREILQVRNTCDIIINKFPQLLDLIVVHGTNSLYTIRQIAQCSFYANIFIIFPIFIHQNANPIGSCFYFYSPLTLMLDILIINLAIIFYFSFDSKIERPCMSLNSNFYKDNFYNKQRLIFTFGAEFFRAGADSLILYYLFFQMVTPLNKLGENGDQLVLGSFIIYTTYAIILFKIIMKRLNAVNYIHLLITILTIGALTGIAFIGKEERIAIEQGFSYLCMVLESFFIIGICYLYECFVNGITELISPNFLKSFRLLFRKLMNKNLFFVNFTNMYLQLLKETPLLISKIDKLTYAEVLRHIFKRNKELHPSLESMADVSNDEIAELKIKKKSLTFYDRKLEIDYYEYNTKKIISTLLSYLCFLTIFWIVDVAIEKFEDQEVSKIIKAIYIIFGFLLLIPSKLKFQKYFTLYMFILLTLEGISIYVEKENNDLKICLQFVFLFSFPLFYSSGYYKVLLFGIIYYIILTMPSIYLNEFGFKKKKNQEFFLYSNLYLLYHRNAFLVTGGLILIFFSYFSEKRHRIDFLKYHKNQSELKIDNQIMATLVPDFVRAKMQRGERGAAYGYEEVTILFCDISQFDSLVAKLSPKELVTFLNELYISLDLLCFHHGLQKIETVGKTYMAAGGIRECEVNVDPETLRTHHAIRAFEFGMDILQYIQNLKLTTGDTFKVKIGIHTGKVIPAVVGNHKPQFSLIGDAVNTTARMCSYSNDNCINCSEFSYTEIKEKYKDFTVSSREVKGKGNMNLYLYNPNKNKRYDNSIQKSISKNTPKLIKQGTKTSMRRGSVMIPNKIELPRKASITENSLLIVENSFDGLVNSIEKMDTSKALNANFNLLNHNPDKLHKIEANLENEKKEEEAVITSNEFFKNSFLLFRFKTEQLRNGFERYQKQKIIAAEKLSITINSSILLVFLIGIYLFSQYALVLSDHIAIFIIVKALMLMVLVGMIIKTQFIIKTYYTLLSWLNLSVFLALTIINAAQMNDSSEEFLINLAMEELLIILAVNLNGLLTYYQSFWNLLIYIVIFLVNLLANNDNHLMVKYNVILILFSMILFTLIVIKYYYSTFDFLLNQTSSKALENREKMLFNLMPLHVVQNMKDDVPVADVLDNVTMLFADIVRFTDFGNSHEPVDVVKLVSELFKRFDNSTKDCSVYKVHTIGDCYVVMGFTGKVSMNERNYYEEAKNVCKMGENMIKIIREVRKEVNFEKLDMRIGIHTGPIIAGIIGSTVVRYDIFGSDVLIANKMESSGLPGKINISEDTKKLLESKEMPYNLTLNKVVEVPSVGRELKCYFIENEVV